MREKTCKLQEINKSFPLAGKTASLLLKIACKQQAPQYNPHRPLLASLKKNILLGGVIFPDYIITFIDAYETEVTGSCKFGAS